MTEKACGACVKRHVLALVDGDRLECRALPPVQEVAKYARFPVVREDDYCHTHFELDAEAAKARAIARRESGRLDAAVAATQARAADQARLDGTGAATPPGPEPSPAETPTKPNTTPRRGRGKASGAGPAE